jgi:LmbE family N-acetylglucosaminyl deacetylase
VDLGFERVLVLSPHTDDAELAAGATIARLLENGSSVHVMVFSTASDALPPGSDPMTLRDEFQRAAGILGLSGKDSTVLDYPVRRFPEHRQGILEELLEMRRDFHPDLVIAPGHSDIHQDHSTVRLEAARVFKHSSLWGADFPWNDLAGARLVNFVRVEERHLEVKQRALAAYQSQVSLGREYFDAGFIEGLARIRGVQAGMRFAEAFGVERQVW